MDMQRSQRRAAALAVALAAILPLEAAGGAFQLNERSARAQGASFAGSVSGAGDITFIGFNPATLGAFDGLQIGGSASYVTPVADAVISTGPFAGFSTDADRGRGLIAGAVGYRVNDWLALGLANNSPFGLVSQYPFGSPFSGDATTSELATIQVSPMVAVTPLPGLSFGASLNILYANARLASGVTLLKGDGTEIGFSLGARWEVTEQTALGVAYHAGYDLTLQGFQQVVGATPPVPVTATASLPGTLQLGVTHKVNDNLTVMAEGRWINWSVFDQLDFSSPSLAGAPPPLNFFSNFNEVQGYEDSFFAAVGTEYRVTDRLTLRGGVAFDQTPTTDRFRTLRVPDEDRIWASIGGTLDVNEHMTLDIAYSYLFAVNDPQVTLRNGPLAGTVVTYDGGAHILSIGGSIRF